MLWTTGVGGPWSEWARVLSPQRKLWTMIMQRFWNIKFYVKLNRSAAKTHGMMVWFKEFINNKLHITYWGFWVVQTVERWPVEAEDRRGRPPMSRSDDNLQKLRYVLNSDWHLSMKLVIDKPNLDKNLIFRVVTQELSLEKCERNWRHIKQPPKSKKAYMSRSCVKKMLILFLNANGCLSSG